MSKTSTPYFPSRRRPLRSGDDLTNTTLSPIEMGSKRSTTPPLSPKSLKNNRMLNGQAGRKLNLPKHYQEEEEENQSNNENDSKLSRESHSEDESEPSNKIPSKPHEYVQRHRKGGNPIKSVVSARISSNKGNSVSVPKTVPEVESSSNLKYLLLLISFVILSLTILWVITYLYDKMTKESAYSIEKLQNEFPLQTSDLWLALETSIKEIENFQKPWNIMLLYDTKSEKTLEKLLEKVTYFAKCKISSCQSHTIILTDKQLNSPIYINDYGVVIDDYKASLEKNGVMVVKNLENVSGHTAQAFHAFCDAYTPLVEKALIIFTFKIDSEEKALQAVEDKLRKEWTNINPDIFGALFTRITSTLIRIQPEVS